MIFLKTTVVQHAPLWQKGAKTQVVLTELRRALTETGAKVEELLAPKMPVNTGQLRGSLHSVVTGRSVVTGTPVVQGVIMEHGRKPGARRPPLGPIALWVLRKIRPHVLTYSITTGKAAKVLGPSASAKAGLKKIAAGMSKKDKAKIVRAMGRAAATKAAERLAFVIARSIAKKGIKARHMFESTTPEAAKWAKIYLDAAAARIAAALGGK